MRRTNSIIHPDIPYKCTYAVSRTDQDKCDNEAPHLKISVIIAVQRIRGKPTGATAPHKPIQASLPANQTISDVIIDIVKHATGFQNSPNCHINQLFNVSHPHDTDHRICIKS